MKSYDELSVIVKSIEPVLRENAAEAEAKCGLPKAVVDAVRNAGNSIFADAFNPPGQSVPATGGYKLTGQFPFASNCKHADWFMALGVVMEGNGPRTVDGMPVVKIHAFPMKEAQIVENWDTLGMRGTGSHDVKATDLFVPVHRTADMAPVTKAANKFWASSFTNMTAWHIVAGAGMVSLGIARAAMDAFIGMAKAKTPAYQTATVNTQTLAHYRLGGARANMYETIGRVWESANAGNFNHHGSEG